MLEPRVPPVTHKVPKLENGLHGDAPPMPNPGDGWTSAPATVVYCKIRAALFEVVASAVPRASRS